MTFNIDGRTIDIPDVVAKDYRDTMKLELCEKAVFIYLGIAEMRGLRGKDVSEAVVDELYNDISIYDTFTGRHDGRA